MRLTTRCLANVKGHLLKLKWKNIAKFKNEPVVTPSILAERGITVVDPNARPPKEPWTPPVEDDERFYKPPDPTENENWHEDPIYKYHHRVRFIERMKQACLLTKSQSFHGMPKAVEDLIDKVEIPDQDSLVQRYIMQSQVWDPTMQKLPRRIDRNKLRWKFQREFGIPSKKSAKILMTNLARLCQAHSYQIPGALEERRLILRPYVKAHYYFRDNVIQISGENDMLITSSRPLPQFADEELVDSSVNVEVEDIFPLLPTIDLMKENVYTLNFDTGFKDYIHSHPHTLLMINNERWRDEERQCRALMYCFAYALSQARYRYGDNVQQLPAPISIQNINMDQNTINFTFFQLNTLNFESDAGVKNFVWFDTGNKLFEKHLRKPWNSGVKNKVDLYDSYDAKVFRKFLAVVLYGINGI